MRFLIIDDNPSDRELNIRELRREFPEATFGEVIRRADFEKALSNGGFDVVITDYRLQWTDGLWILQQLMGKYMNIPIIMTTESGGEEIAVEGMKHGLSDYILKRNLRRLPMSVRESLEKAELRRERDESIRQLRAAEALLRRQNAELKQAVSQKYSPENIIGNSSAMIDVLKRSKQVALTDATVLIYGETGTGKELIARAIHQIGPRSARNFVPINCGAIPGELLESELFGHERGSFTGATARRIGRFEEADGGTLFLDEIGDMPPNLQVKLLRVLQEGIIHRLGSNRSISTDVRVIAATHEDLKELIAAERFREDLYYRLRIFDLELPPLRERLEDVPLLVKHFLANHSEKLNTKVMDIDDVARSILCNYSYPGNVRELEHIIQRAMILCNGEKITVDELPKDVLTSSSVLSYREESESEISEEKETIPKTNEELKKAKTEAQARIERLFLRDLLSQTHGNVSEAARRAGMNRYWLMDLIRKHQIDPRQFRALG